jgi:hypothetical protein
MYKLLFIIIALFVIMFSVSQCNEGFTNTVASTPEVTTSIPITSDNVADYIYKIYKADVKAIQNLADIAMKLQAGGVTVPGNMMIQNTLSVTNDTTLSGKLNVSGASALGGVLGVTGATTLSSTLGVTGDTNIGGNLNVTGGTTVKGNITTNSDITFIQNNNGQDNGSYVIFNNEPNTRGRGANINTRGLYMYAYGTSGNWGKGQTDHDFVISVQPTLVNIGNNLNIGGTLTVNSGVTIKGGVNIDGTTIASLINRIDNLENRCGNLENRCGNLENRCGALENRCGALENRCGNLEATRLSNGDAIQLWSPDQNDYVHIGENWRLRVHNAENYGQTFNLRRP